MITRAAGVFVVLGLIASALLYDRLEGPVEAAVEATDPPIVTPSVSDPARLDGAWYCALGSSTPGGFADHEVEIVNLSDDTAVANLTILTGEGKGPSLRIEMTPQSTRAVALSSLSQADVAGAVVEIVGGTGVVAHRVSTAEGTAEGPCATHVASSWFFASGRTTRDSKQYLALMNPFPEGAVYNVEFYRSAGRPRRPNDLQGGVIPPSSVQIIEVESYIAREEAVAASVTTIRGRLVVERLQVLDGVLGPSGAALQLGVVAPAVSWMLPAGRIHEGGDDRVVVFNPSATESAQVDVELWPVNPTDRSLYGLGPIPRELPPGRFEVVDLNAEADRFGIELPYELGVSVTATNGMPVVVERWQFAQAVDTNLIGAGGTEVAPQLDDEDPDAEGDSADGTEDTDPAPGDDPVDGTDGADPTAEDETGEGTDPATDGAEPGELDVPGIVGDIDTSGQPTADVGIATSRGSEVLSDRWIVPWVPTPADGSAAIVVTSTQGASVEIRALVNGVLEGPFLASVAPFGRAVVPLDIAAVGAPVLVEADGPVSVEAHLVVPGERMAVVPGLPTVDQ